MLSKLKKIGASILIILFWLLVWEAAARYVNLSFVLPTVPETFSALLSIIKDQDFLISSLSSVFRISLGFLLGLAIAVGLGILAIRFPFVRRLLAPINTIAKTTPVAVIIMIMWLMIGGARVPGVVSALIVTPLIWQNLLDGYDSIDKGLDEVCKIYQFNFLKRLRFLVLPTLFSYLLPSIVTAYGLAWKAGIAAEIICMTKDSIGSEIYNAKIILDGPVTFAWTIIILILSWVIEHLIKLAVKGVSRKCHLN
jgi:NitT/TauT family transport system permease protein